MVKNECQVPVGKMQRCNTKYSTRELRYDSHTAEPDALCKSVGANLDVGYNMAVLGTKYGRVRCQHRMQNMSVYTLRE